MKTKLLLSISVMLMFSLPAMGVVTHSCTFSLSDWNRQVESYPGYELAAYSYTGLYSSTQPGQPMLPSRRVMLAVPYNATAFTITVTDSTATDTLETFTLKPMPQPRYHDESAGEDDPAFDQTIYSTNAFFPVSPVMFGGEGYFLGEHHLLTLDVFPMRYNPITHQLRRYTNLSFTVSWTTSAAQGTRAIVRSDPYARSTARAEAQSMVANPNQVAQFAPPIMMPLNSPLPGVIIGPDDPGYGGMLTTSVTNYAIITTDSLKHALRKLVALKRQKGYSVTVKTVDEIANDPVLANGDCVPLNDTCSYINDNAGKMRQWLRNSFCDNNTQYVLMAGKDVPFRYDRWESYGIANIPTDWYFCDLNTNWNIDGDDYFGESTLYKPKSDIDNDSVFDMEPDLLVGRLMFENKDDVNYYTNKLLRYELNPGCGNTEYLGRVVDAVDTSFHNAQKTRTEFEDIFQQTDVVFLKNHQDYPTAKELIDSINHTQYGLICIEAHGQPNAVQVKHTHSGNNTNYLYSLDYMCGNTDDSSLNHLLNYDKPSVLYAVSCATMPFDTLTLYDDVGGQQIAVTYTCKNMGQSYTLGENYGGPAYIGYTRECNYIPGSEDDYITLLMRKFIAQLDSGRYNIGKAEALSKYDYTHLIDDDALENNLMGDPEFEIWTSSLTPFIGITVSRTNNSITVSGIDSGDDIASVSYCNNTAQWAARAVNGTITFGLVDPNSSIMVRSHSKLPYIAPLVLQNTTISNSQYVIASDVVAGNHVDSGRRAGDVIIAAGVDYEIEHKGSVTLAPGFKVQKGASLSIKPSEY